jgi:hypothetical protein
MARPSRNTVVLIAVVAVLGLAALGETLRTQLMRPSPLTALDQRQIHQITLECQDCPRRVLQKITGRWVLDDPYVMPADPAQVERLLALAAAPVRHRRNVRDLDLTESGLNPSKSSVTLGTVKIEFGARDTVRRMRFVRRGDDAALVPDSYAELPKITAEALVDPHPFANLGPITEARLDDKAFGPAARERMQKLQAERVQAAPPSARGRALIVAPQDSNAPQFQLCRYGDHWELVRTNPALAYVLSSTDADVLLHPDAKPN